MQPTLGERRLVSAPSLILHGRTEIKARALVLGEVSALSFCLLAILPSRKEPQKTENFLSLILCFCLFLRLTFLCPFVAQFAS